MGPIVENHEWKLMPFDKLRVFLLAPRVEMSGCGELNSVFAHPKRAYCRYTTPRLRHPVFFLKLALFGKRHFFFLLFAALRQPPQLFLRKLAELPDAAFQVFWLIFGRVFKHLD